MSVKVLLIISIIVNITLVVYIYKYTKKIRIKINKFIQTTKKLIKENKQKFENELQNTIEKKSYEFDEQLRRETKLRMLAEQSENATKKTLIEIQQQIHQILMKVLDVNKDCIQSNYKTLQALKNKYVKAIDLQIERKTLNEKNRAKLLRRFEKLEGEITNEIKNSITTEIVAKSFKEIKQKIEQAVK